MTPNAVRVKYTLLLPLNYNDGSQVPDAERDEILDAVYSLTGGYTLAETVTGAYRSKDGTKQIDRSTVI